MKKFFASEVALAVSNTSITAVRTGFRTVLQDSSGAHRLSDHLSGQLPYYYRTLESVLEDFESETNAVDALVDLMVAAPKTSSFRNSHGGEILASDYIQHSLGLKRLYSKLTLTTSEDTNVHKMDALFADISSPTFTYTFVEAKSSIQPTKLGNKVYHRSGILKQMVESLNKYAASSPRMEFVRIRENLKSGFDESQRKIISNDFRGAGPDLNFIGISVTNASSVAAEDDDFILSADCTTGFDYYAVVVTDLAGLASDAYGKWDKIIAAANA